MYSPAVVTSLVFTLNTLVSTKSPVEDCSVTVMLSDDELDILSELCNQMTERGRDARAVITRFTDVL